jgi:LysR family transcriptional regulator, hydrogen peroxide-inducible genes activator
MLLRQLQYALAVETHRSFTKAADICCVTQPTLSQQIRTLEEFLNIEIFDRSEIPIIPTEKGALILDKAKFIVEQAKELELYAKTISNEKLYSKSYS